MIDKSDAANVFGNTAAATASPLTGHGGKPKMDEEPAWKSAFRQTLTEIQDKGFRTYTDELHAKKMEELRAKILESMGFSEDDLDNMPSAQREQIEKMVALEMQKRLAAENTLEHNTLQMKTPINDVASQLNTAPNGLGTGMLLMQELEHTPEPKDKTG